MADSGPGSRAPDPAIYRRLHDVNGQLSVAALTLGLLLEDVGLGQATRESLEVALGACHEAAAHLREIWRMVEDTR